MGAVYVMCSNSMPIMNGSEAASKIRGLGYEGVILGVTGNGLPRDVEEFERSGADRVIVKPLDVHKFDAALDSIERRLL